ncbi:MAG: NAD(P)-dependent oxidoreductase [Chloroflexota bacterium]|nr:NAD(P)-dependent oxidoreductase [Chloroflexota bacterium]MDE2896492.1 NAD(P)-dependent oxidoreductase [Chloroflexota bacterium]
MLNETTDSSFDEPEEPPDRRANTKRQKQPQLTRAGQPIDRRQRLRIPPHHVTKQTPHDRIHNWQEVYYGYTAGPAMFEAQRCIQCPAAPCTRACPIDNDIPGALAFLEIGKLADAAAVFRQTSEMPELCGRLCPQEALCEGVCVVGKNAKPVAIGKLEAFLGDWDRERRGGFPVPHPEIETGQRVAVVGAGPAGLAVAEQMRAAGHDVTVFEAWPAAGGVLRYGIPNFKTAKDIVDEKAEALMAAGVEFRFDTRVGSDVGWDELSRWDAVFLAHGASMGKQLGLEGERLAGVYSATEFLVRANLDDAFLPTALRSRPHVGRNVVVVGGGDTSMDCVRSAIRLGANNVTLLYRRTENEMIGREEERRHAREEGVTFEYLTTPVRLIGKDGAVVGIECVRMSLGEPDDSGRRRPQPVPGSEFVIDCDSFVVAVGYDVGRDVYGDSGIDVNDWGEVIVDEQGRTSRPGVFAGGDNVIGADLVVTALRGAHQAIPAMLNYLEELQAERAFAMAAG